MFERFTTSARAAVVGAQQQAESLGHTQILPEHLLLGLMDDQDGIAAKVLRSEGVHRDAVAAEVATLGTSDAEALDSIGIDLDAVRRRAEETFGPGALDRPRRRRAGPFGLRFGGGHLRFTDAAKKALEQSLREALSLKHNYIGSEHLLLGLVAHDNAPVSRTLRRLGLDLDHDVLRVRVVEELMRAA